MHEHVNNVHHCNKGLGVMRITAPDLILMMHINVFVLADLSPCLHCWVSLRGMLHGHCLVNVERTVLPLQEGPGTDEDHGTRSDFNDAHQRICTP
jgi:hypothetical protein